VRVMTSTMMHENSGHGRPRLSVPGGHPGGPGLSRCAGGGDDGITLSYPGGGGRYGGGGGLLTLALSDSTTALSIYGIDVGLSRCAGGGDDGITLSYLGGGGRYGGGGGLLTLALSGSTTASSISLSKLYLCISAAIRSREGVFLQLHQHRATLTTSTSPAMLPNAIPTIAIVSMG